MSHRSETTSPSPLVLQLNLPPLNDLAPPYTPPAEEKIPYDPSAAVARQRSQKEGNAAFSDWDATQPTGGKLHNGGSTVTEPPGPPTPAPPIRYPVGDFAETDPRSENCLPEVVVTSNLPEVVDIAHRRQTIVSTIQSPQAFSPNNETMSMAPGQFLTVTPLHLLGDQPDMIDCPFCLRRTETKVIREASPMTHILASLCCLTTVLGVFAPYMLDWASHIEQHCTNCNRRVTRRPHGKTEIEVFGTPPDQRMLSRYPAAGCALEEEVPPPPPAKNHMGPSEIYSGR